MSVEANVDEKVVKWSGSVKRVREKGRSRRKRKRETKME